jgi:phosphotransferase system enzyme I (PtsI)
MVPLLIGLGLRQLSATPHVIPELKDVMRRWSIPEAEEVARHALQLDIARDVETYLRGEYHRNCPEN